MFAVHARAHTFAYLRIYTRILFVRLNNLVTYASNNYGMHIDK